MDDCGSRIKQLEQLLSEYQSRLQLDEDSDFSEVHSFGPYNFHQEHNKFKGLLNGIHSRCKQCKSWSNSKHAVKAFVDRQQQIKHLMPIKTYTAECLDKIQGVIRENNLTDTIHRLELITRQVGLKFDVSTTYTECFISSDMFYVEVQLQDNGNILEVKVQHYGDLVPVTCPALTGILRRRDYTEFLKHMQGLANLYQLTGDAFQKSKIFQALVTLEKDLEKIACSDGQKLFEENVLGGPVGFLTPRQGGQLMHLTYFATPLELRSENVSKMNENFDLNSFVLLKFGCSLSISVEQSKPMLLPTSSLLSGEFSAEKRGNPFLPINETNSEQLPASFVLHLDKPLVVSAAILEKIHSTLENFKGEKFVQNSKAYMDCLIIKKWLKDRNMKYTPQMAYHQKLPEEEHIYRISEKDLQGSLSLNSNVGVVISRIPFTHCQNVVKIIRLLRQQLVYNQILTSVLSSQTANDGGPVEYNGPCFDVSTSNPFVVVITFEEPITSSLASVEFQVKADCSIEVRFNPRKTAFYDCRYVSRVIQKCLSIPVTMRYVFKKARKVHASNETPMVVDVDQTDAPFIQPSIHSRQVTSQSSAYVLLASMIAGSETNPTLSNQGMTLPLLSPSPTLQNILQTPSPSGSNIPFVFQTNQDKDPCPVENVLGKEIEQQPQPQPTKPQTKAPIKLKFKKVASEYIIEKPKDNKQEPPPVTNNTPAANQFAVTFDTTGFTNENNDLLSGMPYQQPAEQFIPSADQTMDLLPSESVSFSDVDNTAFLPGPVSTGAPSSEGIFQTLPGGATSSPGGLDVEDTYGFDTGLDAAFDIEAEIEGVGSSDSGAFDLGNVYEPSASTSSTSAMPGSFDIDHTFDLETILASGSQVGDGSSLEWGLGGNGGNDS